MQNILLACLPIVLAIIPVTASAEEAVARLRESIVPGISDPKIKLGPLGQNPPQPPAGGNNMPSYGIGPFLTRYSNEAIGWTKHSPFSDYPDQKEHYSNEKRWIYEAQVFQVLRAEECRAEFAAIRKKVDDSSTQTKLDLLAAVQQIPQRILESESNDLRMKKIAKDSLVAELDSRDKKLTELAETTEKQAKELLELKEQLSALSKLVMEKAGAPGQ